MALLGGGLLFALAACEEPEQILQGVREDIRSDQSGSAFENQARPDSSGRGDQQRQLGAGAGLCRLPNRTSWPVCCAAAGMEHGDRRGGWPSATQSPQHRLWRTVVCSRWMRRPASGLRPPVANPPGRLPFWPPTDADGQATGGGLSYDSGTLYVSSGFGVLTAFDAATGAEKWRQELGSTGSGTPTVSGGLVYLVAGDDTGWAVNAETGRIVWQISATPSASNVLGAPAPVVTPELSIFAFGSGDLVATFKRGGLRRWDASVAGQRVGRATSRIVDVTGSPVVVGNRIYVGNHSGRTVALDTDTGERLWTLKEGAVGQVWPAGDSLFSVTDLSELARIDASDGSLIWKVKLPGFLKDKPRKRGAIVAHYGPILAGGQLVLASNDGLIRFYNPEDGSLIRTIEVAGGASAAPVVAGGTLYIVSSERCIARFPLTPGCAMRRA